MSYKFLLRLYTTAINDYITIKPLPAPDPEWLILIALKSNVNNDLKQNKWFT